MVQMLQTRGAEPRQHRRPFFERLLGAPLALLNRLAPPIGLLVAVFLLGTAGYFIIGVASGKDWPLLDCAFMTSITLTTVGYGDHLGISQMPFAQVYTMFLIVIGMGATLYSTSAVTAFIVEGHMGRVFKEERMETRIERLRGHTIICGAGETGSHVVLEHSNVGSDFCVVDRNTRRLENLIEEIPKALYIEGDATKEETLEKAGIHRAAGLVAALSSDKDNLFLLVTARYMRPDLPIVAKCLDHDSVPKFQAAGATHVVSPTYIGGLRLASQVLRPHVVDFLDGMLRGAGNARVSEAVVEEGSEVAGKTLAEARVAERVGLLVVAYRGPGEPTFSYSPGGDTLLEPGSIVVVIGPMDRVRTLESMVSRSK
jgi:voltage-gated potassium channel